MMHFKEQINVGYQPWTCFCTLNISIRRPIGYWWNRRVLKIWYWIVTERIFSKYTIHCDPFCLFGILLSSEIKLFRQWHNARRSFAVNDETFEKCARYNEQTENIEMCNYHTTSSSVQQPIQRYCPIRSVQNTIFGVLSIKTTRPLAYVPVWKPTLASGSRWKWTPTSVTVTRFGPVGILAFRSRRRRNVNVVWPFNGWSVFPRWKVSKKL